MSGREDPWWKELQERRMVGRGGHPMCQAEGGAFVLWQGNPQEAVRYT